MVKDKEKSPKVQCTCSKNRDDADNKLRMESGNNDQYQILAKSFESISVRGLCSQQKCVATGKRVPV